MPKYNNVLIVKRFLGWILFICSFLEIFYFPTFGNLVGIIITWLSLLIYYKYILYNKFLKAQPLLSVISIMIFGFMYLPMPVTLLDGLSMSHDFYNPVLTFILQFIYFVIVIIAIRIAARLSCKYRAFNKVLNKVGYYTIPSFYQTMLLACIGWFFQILVIKVRFTYGDGEVVPNLGTYKMFSIFIYSPLVNLFRSLLGGEECTKIQKKIVYVYIILMTVVMAATNSRGALVSSYIILGLFFLLKRFVSDIPYNFFTKKNIIITAIVGLIALGPFEDMAYAMLIARGERNNISSYELFQNTIKYFNDKERIKRYKEIAKTLSDQADEGDWNEEYTSNLFLGRFCNYRVIDASIYHAFRIGFFNNEMFDDFEGMIVGALPQPIISIVKPDFNKEKYIFSPMDKLYALSMKKSVYPSYIVGGDVGIGLSIFGFFFFPIILLVYILELILIGNLENSINGKKQYSTLTLINLFGFFLTFQVGLGIVAHITFILWSFYWKLLWNLIPFRLLTFFNKNRKIIKKETNILPIK